MWMDYLAALVQHCGRGAEFGGYKQASSVPCPALFGVLESTRQAKLLVSGSGCPIEGVGDGLPHHTLQCPPHFPPEPQLLSAAAAAGGRLHGAFSAALRHAQPSVPQGWRVTVLRHAMLGCHAVMPCCAVKRSCSRSCVRLALPVRLAAGSARGMGAGLTSRQHAVLTAAEGLPVPACLCTPVCEPAGGGLAGGRQTSTAAAACAKPAGGWRARLGQWIALEPGGSQLQLAAAGVVNIKALVDTVAVDTALDSRPPRHACICCFRLLL